jgi:hypothetical protein
MTGFEPKLTKGTKSGVQRKRGLSFGSVIRVLDSMDYS